MKKRFLYLFILVVLAFALFGCGQTTMPEFTQTQDGITAVFSMSPTSPATMEPTTLSLTLTDSNGRAIEGAQISYDLTMPGMIMPSNQPHASDKGQGLYLADTTFTMSGDWRAEVTVIYNDKTTIFTFDFSIK